MTIVQPNTDRRGALKAAAGSALLPLAPAFARSPDPTGERPFGVGRDQPFDADWRFLRGEGENFEAANVDDSSWQAIDLPHDWSIEDLPPGSGRIGPFDPTAEGGASTGYTIGGEGWYRKRFGVAGLPAQGRVEILFDGAYMVTDVWLNGHHLGAHFHGYAPFAFDLTPHLAPAGDGLRVRPRPEARLSPPDRQLPEPDDRDDLAQAALPASAGTALRRDDARKGQKQVS